MAQGIVVDTSALVAIIMAEPSRTTLMDRMLAAQIVFVGAPTLLEATMVLSGRLENTALGDARTELHGLLRHLGAKVVPFTEDHYETAASAFLRYGSGRHKAKLNYGDCMSYAVAVLSGLPLLYTGTDFSKTDVRSA